MSAAGPACNGARVMPLPRSPEELSRLCRALRAEIDQHERAADALLRAAGARSGTMPVPPPPPARDWLDQAGRLALFTAGGALGFLVALIVTGLVGGPP